MRPAVRQQHGGAVLGARMREPGRLSLPVRQRQLWLRPPGLQQRRVRRRRRGRKQRRRLRERLLQLRSDSHHWPGHVDGDRPRRPAVVRPAVLQQRAGPVRVARVHQRAGRSLPMRERQFRVWTARLLQRRVRHRRRQHCHRLWELLLRVSNNHNDGGGQEVVI